MWAPVSGRAGRQLRARAVVVRRAGWRTTPSCASAGSSSTPRPTFPYYRRLLGDAGLRPGGHPEPGRPLASPGDNEGGPPGRRARVRRRRTTCRRAPTLADRRPRARPASPFVFHADLAAEDTRFATYLLALEWAGVGVWDVGDQDGQPVPAMPPRVSAVGPSRPAGAAGLLGQRFAPTRDAAADPEDLQRLIHQAAGRRAWFLRALPSVMLALLATGCCRSGRPSCPVYPSAIISRGEMLTAVRRVHHRAGLPVPCRSTTTRVTRWRTSAQSCPTTRQASTSWAIVSSCTSCARTAARPVPASRAACSSPTSRTR